MEQKRKQYNENKIFFARLVMKNAAFDERAERAAVNGAGEQQLFAYTRVIQNVNVFAAVESSGNEAGVNL